MRNNNTLPGTQGADGKWNKPCLDDGIIRYSGDVKTKYKLTIREAVVGFVFVALSPMQSGGKCRCSYNLLLTIHPELDTVISGVLHGLKSKGVLDEFSYPKKRGTYLSVVVSRKFAQDVRYSRRYTQINLFDFNQEIRNDWSLNDRVFYKIVQHLRTKKFRTDADTLASFMGVTKQTIINKFNSDKFAGILSIEQATHPGKYGRRPYKVGEIYDDEVRKSRTRTEAINELSRCMWVYLFSGSRFIYDRENTGLLERRCDPKYKGVVALGEKLANAVPASPSDEAKLFRRIKYWMSKYGPGTADYETIKRKMDRVAQILGGYSLNATDLVKLTDVPLESIDLSCAVDLYHLIGDGFVAANAYIPSVRVVDGNLWDFKYANENFGNVNKSAFASSCADVGAKVTALNIEQRVLDFNKKDAEYNARMRNANALRSASLKRYASKKKELEENKKREARAARMIAAGIPAEEVKVQQEISQEEFMRRALERADRSLKKAEAERLAKLSAEAKERIDTEYSPEKEADAIIAKVTELAKLVEESKADNRTREDQPDTQAQAKDSADNDKDDHAPQDAPREDKPSRQDSRELVDEDGISYKYNMASISDFF